MKTKNNQHTIHQKIERLFSHHVSMAGVLFLMLIGACSFDGRMRSLLQEAYSQGWTWMGTYMHHEHPTHTSMTSSPTRIPTISGPS